MISLAFPVLTHTHARTLTLAKGTLGDVLEAVLVDSSLAVGHTAVDVRSW